MGWMLPPPPPPPVECIESIWGREGEEGGGLVETGGEGERERARAREREREGSASAVVWNHSTFSSHTVQPRDLLRAGPGGGQSLRRQSGDRASGWKLTGRPLLATPGPTGLGVCCLGDFLTIFSPFFSSPVPVLRPLTPPPPPSPPPHLSPQACHQRRMLLLLSVQTARW